MFAAPFFVASGLLVASGIGKVLRPAPALSALRSAGMAWSPRLLARGIGVVEVAVGAAALSWPAAVTGGLVAGLYLAFAVFLVRLIRIGGASTCGCVGAADAPPSVLHVALDLVAASVAVAVALWPVPSMGSVVAASPFFGIPLVIGLAGAGALLAVAVVEVPRAWRSYRPSHEEHSLSGRPQRQPLRTLELVERPR